MDPPDLDTIAESVAGCTKCPLHETASRAVPGEGNPAADVVFVGEAPGEHEDRTGRPFVGRAGGLLDELLGQVGWKRDDVFITNIVKHRPPANRDPSPVEQAACRVYLDWQILAVRPLLIVTLGRLSMAHFCGGGLFISKVHGRVYEWSGIPVVPLYHPAAILRNPTLRPVMDADFASLPGILTERIVS